MEINVRINKPFSGYAEGQVVKVPTDDSGTPLSVEWRRRLKDAAHDRCCEVVKPKSQKKAAKPSKSED